MAFAIGTNEYYAGNVLTAKAILSKTLAQRVALNGETHPHALWMLNLFGAIAHEEKDYPTAERFFFKTVQSQEKVLGKDHPTVAIARANLARLHIDQRNFSEAAAPLKTSAQILSTQLAPDHDDLAFIYANLAIAQRGMNDDTAAEATFLKALPIARKHKHRTLAPTLTDLAEIECRSKRIESAMQRLDEAEPLMKATYPKEPWRAAYVDQIRGACLLAEGKRGAGVALLESSAPIIVARWGKAGLFGFEATARLAHAKQSLQKVAAKSR